MEFLRRAPVANLLDGSVEHLSARLAVDFGLLDILAEVDRAADHLDLLHGHDADISADDMAKINAVISGIKDGSLKAQGILRKTSFE